MRPILFQIGPLPLFAYGALVALGALSAIIIGMRRSRDVELPPDRIMDLGLYSVVWGVVGARIFHVIETWDQYMGGSKIFNPETREFESRAWYEIFYIWQGGLVFYGGFIGALLYFIYFFWRNRLSKRQVVNILDLGSACMPLGLALGRMGCWFNGCCYGKVCIVPWAVRFPPHSHLWNHQLNAGLITANDESAALSHPTQLYAWAIALTLFFFLNFIYRRRRFPGIVTGLWVSIYAVARFFVEFLRYDTVPVSGTEWMTISQKISIGAFLVGITGLIVFWRLHRSAAEPAQPAAPA